MAKKIHTPLAAAVGAALATSVAGISAHASENPFSLTELSTGYMVADKHTEGKCGEGKCGNTAKQEQAEESESDTGKEQESAKTKEGKCGEGKCGASQ